MATGIIKSIPKVEIIINAFTFSTTDALQEISLPDYKGWYLLDAYVNGWVTSLKGSYDSHLKALNFNTQQGRLVVERTSVSAWNGSNVSLVMIRP